MFWFKGSMCRLDQFCTFPCSRMFLDPVGT